MIDQKYIDFAIEYARDDAKYKFAPYQEESLQADFEDVHKRFPNKTFEQWLQHCAYLTRENNRAYKNEKYYASTSAAYDEAYIAAIVKHDAEKFPKPAQSQADEEKPAVVKHGGTRPGAGRPPKGTPTKLGTQEQLVVYAKQIAIYRGYSDLLNGLQPVARLREKYVAEIGEFKEALISKTWLHALHESSDVLYYAACIDAQQQSSETRYAAALQECGQMLRFHGIRVTAKQIEAAALAKYAWRAAGKDNKDEAHELVLIESAVSKK